MAMTTCAECGKETSDTARACPHCGHRQKKASSGILSTVLILGAAVVVGLIVMGNSPGMQERGTERSAIGNCWKEQERKSIDASSKQLMIQVCEKMEQDFRDKYGQNP